MTGGLAMRSDWAPLLLTIGRFRCLSTQQLAELAPTGVTERTISQHLRELDDCGFVGSAMLPGAIRRRVNYLTRRALKTLPYLRERFSSAVADVVPDIALYGWQRAEAWVRLRRDGWTVGRDALALDALRQYVLADDANQKLRLQLETILALPTSADGQPIWEPFRCGCGFAAESPTPHPRDRKKPACGVMRKGDALQYDVAYRDGAEPFVLLVDNPYRALLQQLNELPVRSSFYDDSARCPVYQASIKVMFIPSDDGSVWSDTRGWALQGPRLRQFKRYTSRAPLGSGRQPLHFPFCRTVIEIPPLPRLYIRQLAADTIITERRVSDG